MNTAPPHIPCFSCGGLYPDVDGPVHRYMRSSPGCWQVYGQVLAREYQDPAYFEVHRLTVDAYAVQHPGGRDRQSIQSVALHLIRLCQFLEQGLAPEQANAMMQAAARHKATFVWLAPPELLGTVTAADVHACDTLEAHTRQVRHWAHSAWQAWAAHHETIRDWMRLASD